MSSLEQALTTVVRDANRKGGKLTRRFIVTEGLFEADGWISDLEKLVRRPGSWVQEPNSAFADFA